MAETLWRYRYASVLDYADTAIADAPPLNTDVADYVLDFSHANNESILIDPFNSDDYPVYTGARHPGMIILKGMEMHL